jgi:hypothetical protein
MKLEDIDKASAIRLVNRFKAGNNVIFGADLFSVGRERFTKGAERVFTDLELTGDAAVRFIRGDFGVGKTNFCARLFNGALRRGWAAAYIELSEKVTLYEFQNVFSQIVDSLYVRQQFENNPFEPGPPLGLIGILDLYYKNVCAQVGLEVGGDISQGIRADVLGRVNTVLTRWRIYSDFGAALRSYFQARLDGDIDTLNLIKRWLCADPDVRIRDKGILRPIQKINAKDHLRSLSCLLVAVGFKGLLIVLDELERIMQESRTRRLKSYTLLRELIDNVDGENGMVRTCFYCAAPPSQYESEKGFIEVEALASRIQQPVHSNDPTGPIVNLDKAPLTADEQLVLTKRLILVHGIARARQSRLLLRESEILDLIKEINSKRPFSNLRVREFCRELVTYLEASTE